MKTAGPSQASFVSVSQWFSRQKNSSPAFQHPAHTHVISDKWSSQSVKGQAQEAFPLLFRASSPQSLTELQQAITHAQPGDTIYLHADVKFTGTVQIHNKHDLKIVAEPGAKLNGNLRISASSGIEIQNLEIQGQDLQRVTKPQPGWQQRPEVVIQASSQVVLSHLQISHLSPSGRDFQPRSLIEIDETSSGVRILDSHFRSGLAGHQLSPADKSQLTNGIRNMGTDSLLHGNRFENVAVGIQSGGLRATIQSNEIRSFTQDGMQIFGHNTKVIKNNISDLVFLESAQNPEQVAHHDGIQLWAPSPSSDPHGRYTGRYALRGVEISGNTISSTSRPERAYQGVLQGIAAFDGYMDDLVIQGNRIYTHSTTHGISVNGMRSQKRRAEISGNLISRQLSRQAFSEVIPTLQLHPLRYKHRPLDQHEPWKWRTNERYPIWLGRNHISTAPVVATPVQVHR